MYVTDCLRASIGGGETPRYVDLVGMLNNKEHKEVETAEQVIKRLSDGLNRLGGEKHGDIV